MLRFFLLVNQAYFMGLFFLIAGYFTPGAVGRNGPWAYMAERALRLGVPLLVYRLFIGPVTVALALTAAGRPFLATLRSTWAGGDFRSGPLLFVETLLIFTVAYVAWRALISRLRPAQGPAAPFAVPSNTALGAAGPPPPPC